MRIANSRLARTWPGATEAKGPLSTCISGGGGVAQGVVSGCRRSDGRWLLLAYTHPAQKKQQRRAYPNPRPRFIKTMRPSRRACAYLDRLAHEEALLGVAAVACDVLTGPEHTFRCGGCGVVAVWLQCGCGVVAVTETFVSAATGMLGKHK